MSELSDYYKAMEIFQEGGTPASEEQKKKVDQLENEHFKKSVLPILTDELAPALTEIKRDLQIVLDYEPGQPLQVHLYRNGQLADLVENPKVEKTKPIESSVNPMKKENNRKLRKGALQITLENGEVIRENVTTDTLWKMIEKLGVENVRALGLENRNLPLIAKTNYQGTVYRNGMKDMNNGYYLNGNSSTDEKIRLIKKIAEGLGVNIKAEKM